VIRAASRRLLILVAVLIAASAAIAALAALATGDGAARSAALGCYLVGATAGLFGFVLGSRRMFRPTAQPGSFFEPLPAREGRAVAALLMICGVLLILLGAAFDPGASVF
jgi:hypothetical protein